MGGSGNSLLRRMLRKQVADGLPSGVEGRKHFESVARDMDPSYIESGSLCLDEYVRDNSALLSLQPWLSREGGSRDDGQQRVMRAGDDHACIVGDDESEPPYPPTNYSVAYGYERSHRRSITSSARSRSARMCSVKQIDSLEEFEREVFVFGPVTCLSSSSIPCLRPLCATDRNQIINKSGYDPLNASPPIAFKMDLNIASSGETSSSDGSLPEIKKLERKSEEMQIGGPDASDSRGPSNHFTLSETHERFLLFCMGIGIGVMSSKLVNKNEVEQLNNLLKHSENLVQDLQEELDMKESLTVNELVNDAHEQVGTNNKEAPALLCTRHDIALIDQSNSCKDAENSEYLSQIEAELEAELERLELSMFYSNLEEMTSAQDELDPDLISNAVRGELRADKLKKNDIKDEFHEDSEGILTPQKQPVDYSVSPRELRLRLHELNQLTLEERIKELEAKLHLTQKQLQLMEAVKTDVLNSRSDGGYSSNHACPTIREKEEDMSKPLFLNLSGGALYAYEEAYNELARVTDAERPVSSKSNSCEQVNSGDSFFSDGTSSWDLQDEIYPQFSYSNDTRTTRWKNALNHGSNDESPSLEGEDGDEEQMLIQQIVQRVRQDSSVALNTQRMLLFDG